MSDDGRLGLGYYRKHWHAAAGHPEDPSRPGGQASLASHGCQPGLREVSASHRTPPTNTMLSESPRPGGRREPCPVGGGWPGNRMRPGTSGKPRPAGGARSGPGPGPTGSPRDSEEDDIRKRYQSESRATRTRSDGPVPRPEQPGPPDPQSNKSRTARVTESPDVMFPFSIRVRFAALPRPYSNLRVGLKYSGQRISKNVLQNTVTSK